MSVQTSGGVYFISEKRVPNFKQTIGISKESIIISVTAAQSAGYLEFCTYNSDEDLVYAGHLIYKDTSRWIEINVAYI